jgi:hypothetical protein
MAVGSRGDVHVEEAAGAALDTEFQHHLQRGAELLQAGDARGARDALEHAVRLRPRNQRGQNLLGLAYFKLGDYGPAQAVYQRLIDDNPADATLRVNLGLVHLKTNLTEEAIRCFQSALALNPDHLKAENYLGLAYAQKGEHALARVSFVKAGNEQMAQRMSELLGVGAAELGAEGDAQGGGPFAPFRPAESLAAEEPAAPDPGFAPQAEGAEAEAPMQAEAGPEFDQPPEEPAPPPDELGPPPDEPVPYEPTPAPPAPAAVPFDPESLAPEPEPEPVADEAAPEASGPQPVPAPPAEAPEPAPPQVQPLPVSPPAPPAPDAVPPGLAGFSAHGPLESRAGKPFAIVRGFVAIEVTHEILTRVDGLISAGAKLEMRPEMKRYRGARTDQPFGDAVHRMMRVAGEGRLLIARRDRVFTQLDLADENAFLREDCVYAFEESLVFENGRVPSKVSPDLQLVHLRGSGRLLIVTRGLARALTVQGDAQRIPVGALAGWYGNLAPRVLSLSEQGGPEGGPLAVVELSGEGHAIVETGEEPP